MKFKIEVDDFWMDSGSELAPELKTYIINEVVNNIYKKIEKKVEEQINLEVKRMVVDTLYNKTSLIISKVIKTEKVKGRYSGDPMVTIEEHIKEKFLNDSGWSNPNEVIKGLAKEFAAELKQRYDIAFATHIVAKINEQGLLKEEIAKLLIENNGKK